MRKFTLFFLFFIFFYTLPCFASPYDKAIIKKHLATLVIFTQSAPKITAHELLQLPKILEKIEKENPNFQLLCAVGFPLHIAAGYGYDKVVEWLLKRGAKVNQKDKGGETSLHCAARSGAVEVIKVLLANKAEENILNEEKKSPYDLALANLERLRRALAPDEIQRPYQVSLGLLGRKEAKL